MTPTTNPLGDYHGRPIERVSMAVRGLGGGLDDPIVVDPEVVEIASQRMLCVPVVCVEHTPKVQNRKEPDEGDLELVMVFVANGPQFFVDEAVVEQARGEHLTRVMLAQKALDDAKEAAKNAKKGTGAQPVHDQQDALEVDEESLRQAHLANRHAPEALGGEGKNDACPECQWEDDLEEREALGLGEGPSGTDG